ncbi:ETS transcription factor Elf 5 [Fasciola hepatica]|uniref:ETS transcription factor Elf 5 n=1 Tax=Fasciola hepatica TaxID=6192 RepID=A0A4E0RMZ0_FASHE|nr:ETS transcription factor Elf 5 [Fasciola hepatica]
MNTPWNHKQFDPGATTNCSKKQTIQSNFSNAVDSGHLLSQFQIFDQHIQESSQSVHSLSSSPSTESYHSVTFPPYMEESDDSQQTRTSTQLDLIASNYASSIRSDETGFDQFSILDSPILLFNDPESQQILESCIQSELGDGDNDDDGGKDEGPATKKNSLSLNSASSMLTSTSSTSISLSTSSSSLSASTLSMDRKAASETASDDPSGGRSPTSDVPSFASDHPIRPQTLSFLPTYDSSKSFSYLNQCADMPLSFTNTISSNSFLELEEQLASADTAWMGALDIPNIFLDEMDKLLSPTSCLTSPIGETILNTMPDSCNSHPPPHKRCKRDTSSRMNEMSEVTSRSVSSKNTSAIQNTQIQSEQEEVNKKSQHTFSQVPASDSRTNELVDTDSTLTCSEAEYYSSWIEQHGKRARRKRKSRRPFQRNQRVMESESEDSDSGTDEPVKWNPGLIRRLSSTPTARRHTSHAYHVGSALHRRPKVKPSSDADLKPWWPKTNTPFWTGCGISVDVPQSPNDMNSPDDDSPSAIEYEQPTCCMSDADDTPRSNDSGCSCGLTSSSSIKTSKPLVNSVNASDGAGHNNPNSQQNNVKSKSSLHSASDRFVIDEAGHQSIWRARRRRKQLELWQFILCKLETSKQSAFQWVNRSAGVFCITDTIAGAREWGRYRNNSRMDYEKMARAMRFYYKDSILRKSRQQLHFQFAMSYVEWASRFYRSG